MHDEFLQGSLRTGAVFRSIAKYLAENGKVNFFQFENVVALASKPSAPASTDEPSKKQVAGPSNLSAVCYVLDKQCEMWSHVWQVDSREFGSGQQRQRLYGSCFKKSMLSMTLEKAHAICSETMNHLVGVEPCHPMEYLLSETSEVLQAEKSIQLMRSLPAEAFLDGDGREPGSSTWSITQLFQSHGTLPCALNVANKRRKLVKENSDPTTPRSRWIQVHSDAFRQRGEEPLDGLRFEISVFRLEVFEDRIRDFSILDSRF